MNLKQLEYFVKVAELGSFSRAAVVLEIAQPALSRQVRSLEIDLRETLLLRNGRGVTLTEAGRRLFEHGTEILQMVTRARDDVESRRDEPAGRVVIGLPPSLSRALTRPLIDAFRRELPRARLALVEGLSSHIAEWLSTGRVDLALLFNPELNPSIETTPVLVEALCLVAPAGEQRRRRAPLPLADLPQYPLVLPEGGHAFRRLLDRQAALAGIKLDVACEVSSVGAIIDLVIAGYGYAVLTASAVAASGRSADLTTRPITDPPLPSTLFLGVPAHQRPTPLTRRAVELLRGLVVPERQGN